MHEMLIYRLQYVTLIHRIRAEVKISLSLVGAFTDFVQIC